MRTLIIFLLLLPCMCLAQKKKPVKADTTVTAPDTLVATSTPFEQATLKAYNDHIKSIEEEYQSTAKKYEQQIMIFRAAVENMIKMKISAAGGDPSKPWSVKDDKILYLK